ncbi:MAG: glycerol-3-phosphate dehydrogenase C-terminal domain-containing protein, partial [Nevskiaceae bacterium]
TLVVAEAILAIREEMALSLEDVVRRRVPIALLEPLDGLRIKEVSELLAPHLRRDSAELASEYNAARRPIQ